MTRPRGLMVSDGARRGPHRRHWWGVRMGVFRYFDDLAVPRLLGSHCLLWSIE